ncbi:BTAD domain-containing putative transcriptional regulator [Amycolatopsis panacis]|uniref:BTAD domain-containing putative transcriptional regulator n=1 Tax=Amycolatopsis panacis TaxID=2340917 RepID=UPI001F3B25EB|nr:BTAD domain-containing putative transcriptional regulator [Amycolatopsis panacis]
MPLRGTTQRSLLSYLLLHRNEVVATSRLLSALWPHGVPATARKMVQNSVSGLRTVLSAPRETAERAILLTHAPGYLLQVDSELVDAARFQRLAEQASRAQEAKDPDQAAATCREALGLWQGRALADLVETGIEWPELVTLEDQRLGLYEQLFALELARGRHQEVLADLHEQAGRQPQRERLNGQLMIALYRCGRHADALAVYRRTRASLADGLGLEPGKELQQLEHAILNHDTALITELLPSDGVVTVRASAPGGETAPAPALPAPALPSTALSTPTVARIPVAAAPEPPVRASERKPVVVVGVALADAPEDPEDADDALETLRAVVGSEVAAERGHEPGGPGPVLLGLFGAQRTQDDDEIRAVRAALRIRDRLAEDGRAAHVVVDSGDVLVKFPSAVPVVTGGVLDRCVRSALTAPAGQVLVSDEVRDGGTGAIACASTASAGWWAVEAVHPCPSFEDADAGTFVGRDHDLELLDRLMDNVEARRRAHLVTLLGEPGIGKSRLIGQFRKVLEKRPELEVVRLSAAGATVDHLMRAMSVGMLAPNAAWLRGTDCPTVPDLLCDAAENLTSAGPLVVFVEDLHQADTEFRDCVRGLADALRTLPVLIVVTARPELPVDEPGSAGHTTVSLAPLPDEAIAEMLDTLLPAGRRLLRGKAALIARIGGNPLFATAYAQAVDERTMPFAGYGQASTTAPSTPPLVRRTLATLLDSLPYEEKAVLRDAAAAGDGFSAADIAELSGLDPAVAARLLRTLEARELLTRDRSGREPVYSFQRQALREVAYRQIPRSARVASARQAVRFPSRTA